MIQTLLATIIVLSAAAYVAWYLYDKLVREKDKCEGCALKKMME